MAMKDQNKGAARTAAGLYPNRYKDRFTQKPVVV